MEQVRAAQAFAEAELARYREAGTAVSKSELENAEYEYRRTSEEQRSMRIQEEIARFELEQAQAALLRTRPRDDPEGDGKPNGNGGWTCTIYSPIHGQVLRVLQESAAVVTAGTPLLELGDPRDLEAEIDVLSRDAVKIHPGAKVWFEHWGGDRDLQGRVRLVEPSGFTKISTLGVEEQRVNVIVDFVDPPEERTTLGDGFRVEARIVIDEADVGPRGGIRVDEHMQTSDTDIYAVGDAVEVRDFVTGDPIQIPLAGPANRQGRIAADHIFGRGSSYRGTQGTAIVGVFGMAAAMTGLSEKVLTRLGRKYEKIYLHPANHAGYYPGAERISLKLLFDPSDGKILGAQAVGGAGIDKRIDVLAMAIQGDMTVFDLEEAELAYAPQFGSAKDPVNMAGFIAAGVVRGDVRVVHVPNLPQLLEQGAQLVDVRTPAEFERGAIPGAVSIPVDNLRERFSELDRQRPVIAYCQVGMRGYLASRILMQQEYDVANLSGGYTTYCQFTVAETGV